jgi:hypothetical protein
MAEVRLGNNNAQPLARRLFLLMILLSVVAFVVLHRHGIVALLPVTTDYEYYAAFISPTTTTTTSSSSSETKKIVIAYAVSITACSSNKGPFQGGKLFDNAAVLHQSVKLASQRSKYDYHMIAFVHPDATDCANAMKKLGYEVQVRETPFNETEIENPVLQQVQESGCCGSKEYLKLYAYTLLEYPVVVHIDMDTIVLKPMDPMFDLMLDPSFNLSKIPAMWLKPEDFPPAVDFMYTRDYNMVEPPRRKPHQIGVQGGFLVIRPNMTHFERMIEIILSGGGFVAGVGWGGQEGKYGGYYGAGTIQGLASYYYGEFEKKTSLELNRCYYNTMVDDPKNTGEVRQRPKTKLMCRTLEEECEDCRKTKLDDIYNAHFTVCGKPPSCSTHGHWVAPHMEEHQPLCLELFHKWHLVRRSLEDEWKLKYPDYDPKFFNPNVTTNNYAYLLKFAQGHCMPKRQYVEMTFPSAFTDDETVEVLVG